MNAAPTAVAPTVMLATERVRRHVDRIAKALDATVEEFYLCDPSTQDVENRSGTKWVEGMWGARMKVGRVSSMELWPFMADNTFDLIEFTVDPHPSSPHHVRVGLGLTARVMRH